MTTREWAEVLAGLDDPGEIRDCLLVLADDLPDDEACVLREMARREVRPHLWTNHAEDRVGMWASEHWWREHGMKDPTFLVKYPHCVVPDALMKGMKGNYYTKNSGLEWFRDYPTPTDAWLALLEALPAYVREPAEVTG